jgi:hypothetical protein
MKEEQRAANTRAGGWARDPVTGELLVESGV